MFTTASKAFDSCAEFRRKRTRFLKFTYGRQWDDLITDPRTGRLMTEGESAVLSGNTPLTNNLIRQMVKTVVGRYRNLSSDRRDSGSFTDELARRNQLDELDARNLEEFLISGMAVQKLSFTTLPDGSSFPFIENVNPSAFFISDVNDPRGFDIELIGMLHDLSLGEVMRRFAGEDPARAATLREIYSGVASCQGGLTSGKSGSFTSAPAGKCRVIEVWHLENRELLRVLDEYACEYSERDVDDLPEIESENLRRGQANLPLLKVKYECRAGWVCSHYSHTGQLLSRRRSPLPDGGHPFFFKLYPLIDGEIHPFVEDIVDQQRCINRMISTIDNIMAASAKGLLLYPANLKPDNLSWRTIAERWTKVGGIIPYLAKPGLPMPQQVTASGLDAGASHLLDIQTNMMKNISGVTDTLMGKASSPSSGIDRFEAELRNATIALTDILDTYSSFINNRNERIQKLTDNKES